MKDNQNLQKESTKAGHSKVGRPKKSTVGGRKKTTAAKGKTGKQKGRGRSEKTLSEKELKAKQAAAEEARREENIAVGICPFFKSDRECGRVSCEGANFHFPDKEARREFVYRFCAHPDGYKECPLQTTLNHYYERKYAQNE